MFSLTEKGESLAKLNQAVHLVVILNYEDIQGIYFSHKAL